MKRDGFISIEMLLKAHESCKRGYAEASSISNEDTAMRTQQSKLKPFK